MDFHFVKYQALGNDMIVIDPVRFERELSPAAVRLICDRHQGPGADGICYGPLPEISQPHTMRFFNPDGSESEKSGNGLRIFARYLWDYGYVAGRAFQIGINNEVVEVEIKDEAAQTIATSIGRLSFASQDIPVRGPEREVVEETMTFGDKSYQVTAVSAGNPHCVIFTGQLSAGEAQAAGPLIENDPRFPNRTNVQFVKILDRRTIQIEIWERGAGYTLASGTSASAAAGASVKTGRCDSPLQVRMPGGQAAVAIDPDWQVTLTGSVEAVYRGLFAEDFLARLEKF